MGRITQGGANPLLRMEKPRGEPLCDADHPDDESDHQEDKEQGAPGLLVLDDARHRKVVRAIVKQSDPTQHARMCVPETPVPIHADGSRQAQAQQEHTDQFADRRPGDAVRATATGPEQDPHSEQDFDQAAKEEHLREHERIKKVIGQDDERREQCQADQNLCRKLEGGHRILSLTQLQQLSESRSLSMPDR